MHDQLFKWFAVYTKPRWEKRVSQLLSKKRIENYCPLNKVQRQWRDRKKIIEEPIFTSYVFVKISPNEHRAVLETDGVFNFVYWLGKPAVIKDEEITTIKKFLSEYECVELEKTKVDVDDVVRVTRGPLMYKEGKVIDVMQKTVKLKLPSLGYALVVHIDRHHIEKIKSFSSDQSFPGLRESAN